MPTNVVEEKRAVPPVNLDSTLYKIQEMKDTEEPSSLGAW